MFCFNFFFFLVYFYVSCCSVSDSVCIDSIKGNKCHGKDLGNFFAVYGFFFPCKADVPILNLVKAFPFETMILCFVHRTERTETHLSNWLREQCAVYQLLSFPLLWRVKHVCISCKCTFFYRMSRLPMWLHRGGCGNDMKQAVDTPLVETQWSWCFTHMGPDAETVKPRRTFPISLIDLNSASGAFVDVHEVYSWDLAGRTVVCESRKGIFFTALGW